MNNLKSEIIEHLTNIKNYLIQLKEYYKVQAYSKVLIQLYTLKHPIYNYDDFIKYIKAGDRINKKVKELIETGKIDYEIENIKNDNIYLFKQELNEIYGIGKVKIDEIIANNITSIEQLKNNQHLLNNKQKIGLLYYDDIKKRIPLNEFKLHINLLKKDLKTYDFVGSYRRGSESMGDIDLIIMGDFNLLSYIDNLKSRGYILETLGLGKHKFMGIVRIDNYPARRLDILIAPKEEYYYSVLYFTGSADFNIGFRNYVKSKFNLSLNEHGIKGLKDNFIPTSEKDIFDYFKIPYLKPKDRKIFIIPIK